MIIKNTFFIALYSIVLATSPLFSAEKVPVELSFTSTAQLLIFAKNAWDLPHLRVPNASYLEKAHDIVNGFGYAGGASLGSKIIVTQRGMPLRNPVINQQGTQMMGIANDNTGIRAFAVTHNCGPDKCSDYTLPFKIRYAEYGIQDTVILSGEQVRTAILKTSMLTEIDPMDEKIESITAHATHKTADHIAIARVLHTDARSTLTVQNYQFKEVCSYDLNDRITHGMIKWHPTDANVIGAKKRRGLYLYDMRSKNPQILLDAAYGCSEFDFNETGLQICTTHEDNCLYLWDLRKKKNIVAITRKTVPGSTVRNINGDFFIYQGMEYPGSFSVINTSDFDNHFTTLAGSYTHGTAIHTYDYKDGIFLPNKETGQIVFYNNADNGFYQITVPRMVGTRIKEVALHNLCCIMALELTKSNEDLALFKSPEYREMVSDTAAKDSCFNAILTNF